MCEHRSDAPALTRRRVVLGIGAATLGGLGGCTTAESDGSTGSPSGTTGATTAPGTVEDEPAAGVATSGPETGTTRTGTTGSGRTTAPTAAELDLREANVVDVAVEAQDGRDQFSVTLYHDDDGEDGYADWWQVETPAGDRLGRRELLHAHGTRPFTRSATIEVPPGVTCVVVRGHDQTHGYGGRAMLVNLDTGATDAVDQGPDRRVIDPGQCP